MRPREPVSDALPFDRGPELVVVLELRGRALGEVDFPEQPRPAEPFDECRLEAKRVFEFRGDVMLKGPIQTMGESPVDTIGLRLHHGQTCMVYRYSLESTVSLLLAPLTGVTIKMVGPSCFQGTITAEIDTGLISAADFTEHVFGTNYLGAQKLHDFVTRRDGRVVRITKEQYDREEVEN